MLEPCVTGSELCAPKAHAAPRRHEAGTFSLRDNTFGFALRLSSASENGSSSGRDFVARLAKSPLHRVTSSAQLGVRPGHTATRPGLPNSRPPAARYAYCAKVLQRLAAISRGRFPKDVQALLTTCQLDTS
ncbi:hypothetical protein HAX54_033589 [Datura stramonium]|uniref:Uncharacterized protein n=1 Tax=Datura stramonium TaxID=4076 RepID=A0ABS8VFN6_DATST|nr:hypothetical protein [Datura stramonium]